MQFLIVASSPRKRRKYAAPMQALRKPMGRDIRIGTYIMELKKIIGFTYSGLGGLKVTV
jgi:hypothetical protein